MLLLLLIVTKELSDDNKNNSGGVDIGHVDSEGTKPGKHEKQQYCGASLSTMPLLESIESPSQVVDSNTELCML